MRENVLRIFESLRHLLVVAVESLTERHDRTLSTLVDVGHKAVFGVQQDLGVVLEIDLDNLVAESEHNCMLRAHPLLDVHGAGRRTVRCQVSVFLCCGHVLIGQSMGSTLLSSARLQVGFEMLQQSHLLF